MQESLQLTKKQRTTKILVHVVLWMIFLNLPTLFNPRRITLGLHDFVDDLLLPSRALHALLLIFVFYANYYFAIPKLYLRQKYVQLVLWCLLCFSLFVAINQLVPPKHMGPPMYKPAYEQHQAPGIQHNNLEPYKDMQMHKPRFFWLGNSFKLFMFLVVVAASFALCLYELWQKAKQEKLSTEIAFLKAQINPHFLFNTLNSIYSLALTNSDKVADAVMKLSGLMRYSVSDADRPLVDLAKELSYLENFIDLQRLRLTDNVNVVYERRGAVVGKEIAPFLLIPFVENAFKYGVSTSEDCKIGIIIDVGDNTLSLQVRNDKVPMRGDINQGIGLGINSTRKRLEYLYPGKHELEIVDAPQDFSVLLKIRFV